MSSDGFGGPEAGIVIAGGRAARLGGTDKASVVVDGTALVDHALAALASVSPMILVGPAHLARPGVVLTREDPPLGGPAAALAAGLQALADAGPSASAQGPAGAGTGTPSRLVWLLACDLPRANGLVETIRHELVIRPLQDTEDGVIIRDANGRDQWLAGIYRVSALRDSLTALGDVNGAPLRRVVGPLNLRRVRDARGDAVDLDTWDDVNKYTEDLKENTMHRTPPPELDEWIKDLAPALRLDASAVPAQLLLDLTRDVAHTVTRPAGPITTYLIGQAVAAGATPEDAAATVSARVEAWRAAHPQEESK